MIRNIRASAILIVFLVSSGSAWESSPSQLGNLRHVGDELVRKVASYSLDNPGAPGTVSSWETASTEQPLLVGAPSDSEPDFAFIPVTNLSGRWIGSIGVDVAAETWLWYAEAESPRLPPPTIEEISASGSISHYGPGPTALLALLVG
jgi:hypothetical protein